MEGVLYTTRERERREEKGAMRKMKKRQNRGLAWRHTKKKKKKRNNQKGLSFSLSHIFTITGTLTKSSFNKNLDNSELKCVNQVLKSIPFSTSTESCKVKSSFWKFCLFNEFLVQLNSLSLSAWESWLCWPSCLKWLDAINVNDFFGLFRSYFGTGLHMAGTLTNGGRTQSSSSSTMNSSSLPSLFRGGQSSNRRVSTSMLVSTECQTDSSLVVVQQQVREENARNGDHMDPSTSATVVVEVAGEEAAPRRRRREKRRHRRSHQVVSPQPLQQHVQQVLHDQTMVVVDPGLSSSGGAAVAAPVSPSNSDHLPDILNAHMPPPYSTLPHNSERCMGMGPIPITALPVPLSAVPTTVLPSPPPPTALGLHSSTPITTAVVASTGPLLQSSSSFSLPPAGGRRYKLKTTTTSFSSSYCQ